MQATALKRAAHDRVALSIDVPRGTSDFLTTTTAIVRVSNATAIVRNRFR